MKEALSMANWVIAFLVAVTFRDALTLLLVEHIESPSLREMAAFAALFAATLIVGAMVNHLLGEIVRMTGLSGTDRFLGILFGAVRGFIVVMALLLLIPPVIPINEEIWWTESALIPQFLAFESWVTLLFNEATGLISGIFK